MKNSNYIIKAKKINFTVWLLLWAMVFLCTSLGSDNPVELLSSNLLRQYWLYFIVTAGMLAWGVIYLEKSIFSANLFAVGIFVFHGFIYVRCILPNLFDRKAAVHFQMYTMLECIFFGVFFLVKVCFYLKNRHSLAKEKKL